ncbi:MAG: GNAT family N-acetyltransferase [Balneolaceae bacterium]
MAVVGLERLEHKIALLRSLAVDEQHRGTGLGQNLVRHAEKLARSESIEEIWLLTDSASGFFQKLGYKKIPRTSAPNPVRTCTQFRHLCPSSADLMIKKLKT